MPLALSPVYVPNDERVQETFHERARDKENPTKAVIAQAQH